MEQPSQQRLAGASSVGRSFVGRSDTLAILERVMRSSLAGETRHVLLHGDPGIGKSRLLQEASRRAREMGLEVLHGRCAEAPGTPDYWPFVQILTALRERGQSDPHRILPEDSPVFRLLQRGRPSGALDSLERFRVEAEIGEWISAACDAKPLAILLDDLHAADSATAHLLDFLTGALETRPLLVIAGARGSELAESHRVREALGRFLERATSLPLRPLDRPETAALAAAYAGPDQEIGSALGDLLYERSAGNPLFLRQLVELLLAGSSDLNAPASLERLAGLAPEGVKRIVRERIRSLETGERTLLDLAAVLGPDFPRELLEILAKRQGLEDVPARIEDLIDRGLLRELAEPIGHVGFPHAILRDVFYDDLDRRARRSLHAAACEVLLEHRDLGEDVWLSAAAHHAFEGRHPEALVLASRAGERALERSAYEGATHWFRMALSLLGQIDGSTRERARLEERHATARWRAGAAQEARIGFERALELARVVDDAKTFAEAAIGFAGRTDRVLGSETEARAYLKEALERLGPEPTPARAEVLHRMASSLYFESETVRREAARAAVDCAEEVGDPRLLSYALSSRHFLLWRPGELETRRAVGERQLAEAERASHPDALALAHFNCAKDAFERGDGGAADRHIAELGAVARRLRQPFFLFQHAGLLATRAIACGRLAEAEALAPQVLAHGRRAESANALLAFTALSFALRQAQGRLGELEEPLSQAVHREPRVVALRFALAEAKLAAGRASEARAFVDDFISGELPQLPRDFNRATLLGSAARLALALADERWAAALRPLLEEGRGQCAVLGFGNGWDGAWDYHRGRLCTLLGDFEAAEAALDEAVRLHARFGTTPWTARAWMARAELCARRRARGDAEHGARRAREAGEIFETLGYPDEVREARALLASLEQARATARESRTARRDAPRPARIVRQGDYWTLEFEGREVRLRDAKGLADLASLITRPHQEVPAFELYASGPIASRSPTEDALLDSRARAAYRERLSELREELARAEQDCDSGVAQRARAELEILERELAAALGLGGRARRHAGAAERARKAVSNRIRSMIRRVGEVHPALGRHLAHAVQTGRTCSYRPAIPIDWET